MCCRRGEVSQNFVLPVGMKCDVFDVLDPTSSSVLSLRAGCVAMKTVKFFHEHLADSDSLAKVQ